MQIKKIKKQESKNNFRSIENIAKSQYRLIMYYLEPFRNAVRADAATGMKVYYGFNSKQDKGLSSLHQLAISRQGQYTSAAIFEREGNNFTKMVRSFK